MISLPSIRRAAALFVCVAAFLAAASVQGSTLRRGIGGEPGTLDPQLIGGVWESIVVEDLFVGLTTNDAKGDAIPGVAESWTVSPDGTRYSFKIRPGITWSDGTPVTAEDAVFGLQRALDPATASQMAQLLYIIKNGAEINAGKMPVDKLGVSAPDDHTVVIDLVSPAPYFLDLLANPVAYPVPKRMIEKYGKDWIKPGNAVSDGPYKLVDWVPQSHIEAVKNPKFYDAKSVDIDKVLYYTLEDSAAALQRFRAGEFDITYGAPLDQLDWLKKNMADEIHLTPSLSMFYIAFNMTKPPFNDKRVRLALSMLIEREIITDKILKTGSKPAYGLVPPGIKNYGEPVKASFASMSPADRLKKARELLKEAGYGPDHPLHVTLRYNTGANAKKLVTATAAMWKRAGVETDLLNADVTIHYAALRQGDFQAALAGWIADYDDPQDFLLLFQDHTGSLNYSHYNSPKFEALMQEATDTVDIKKRAALMRQAEVTMISDVPIAPVWYSVNLSLVSTAVKGWVDNLQYIHPTRFLTLQR